MKRMQKISQVGLVGVCGNFFLMFLKLMSGILFSSQAMIADGVNSAMDIFASFMTLTGGMIAKMPRDGDHQFGHGKAEFLFSLFVSISMIGGAIFLLVDSVKGLFHGHEFSFSYLLLFVCIITILVKFALYWYSRKAYYETHSLLIQSNMLDHRNDMIITTFTFISILLSAVHFSFLDSIMGIFIALWIFYTGVKVFLDSYAILMDQAIGDDLAEKMQSYILKEKEVKGFTKFETVPAGHQYVLILSILVDGNLKTYESHEIADRLEKKLLKKFDELLAVTIHINPIQLSKTQKH